MMIQMKNREHETKAKAKAKAKATVRANIARKVHTEEAVVLAKNMRSAGRATVDCQCQGQAQVRV